MAERSGGREGAAPVSAELTPHVAGPCSFRVDVRVNAPQLEDWLTCHEQELRLFDAVQLFRVWCRRIRRGTRIGREYKPVSLVTAR